MIEHIKINFSKRNLVLITIALLLIALLSIFVVTKIVTAPDFNAATIESLDEKKNTVIKLAAAAAASSTALSLIPGDAAMPIANQIAELTSYFVFILGAILLGKMLITTIGFLSFTIIVPLACLLGVLYLYLRKDILIKFAIKLAVFGIVLFAAIPVSIHVSDLIYDSYHASIEQTVETAKQNEIEDSTFLVITSKIINDISNKGEETLTSFLEAIAILIITSCVIPIVVLLIFAWIIKLLFGFDRNAISMKKTRTAETCAIKAQSLSCIKVARQPKLPR